MMPKRSILLLILLTTCLVASNAYAQSAQDHYNKAKELLNQVMYDQALAEVTKAIQIDPSVADYYTFRGELYRNRSDITNAAVDYSKSIELNPSNAEVYYFRAICYRFSGKYDLAWADVHKAQDLGYVFPAGFIADLQNVSGRDK